MTTLLVAILFASVTCSLSASNLTCYQCKRSTTEECGIEDLKPCLSIHDRCAIHYTKNSRDGLSVKRECGLAPCGFEDEMAAKGLGMNCDRSQETYACTFCCKENGCNKNSASSKTTTKILVCLTFIWLCLLNATGYFITPYVMNENIVFKK